MMGRILGVVLGMVLGMATLVSAQTPTLDQVYDQLLQSIAPRGIVATDPVPGATGVPITASLSWTGLWLETSTVYLSVCSVTTAPPAVAVNIIGTRWTSPTPLQANTQYCWRVAGRNRAGASTNTTVWRFTTAAGVIPAPTITCPVNQAVAATAATGIAITYPAAMVTGGAPPVTVTSDPTSGSLFPVGATAVTMVATDALRVSASCMFTVTVTYTPPPPPPVLTVSLSAPQSTVTCSPTIGPTLRLTAMVTGLPSPQRVEFVRDGTVMATVTAAPWIMDWQLYCAWTQGGPAPGRATTLTARRVDATGTIESAPLAILVLDGAPPPPPPPTTFNFSIGWDPNAPTDQVLDYQLVVDTAAPVVVPPVLDATCACVKPPPITVLAGAHTLSVRARNVAGFSQPAVLTVTRP